MSVACPECDSFVGRKKEICEGVADLPVETINQYRIQWGLPPIARHDARVRSITNDRPRRTVIGRSGCCGKSIVERAKQLVETAVDFWRDGMAIASQQQQSSRLEICKACPLYQDGWCNQAKGGCGCNLSLKVKARAAYCPQGKWFAETDQYRPLVNPTRSLMFHLYAKAVATWNWHWHIEKIRQYAKLFNGKIVIGINYESAKHIDAIKAKFDGINVTDWVLKQNTKQAETLTHLEMLERLETTDPNAILFRYHTKGVTKRPNSFEQTWARIMWDANMDLRSVDMALASHLTCGVLRSQKPLVSKKGGNFFFAGSAYWMRSKEVFERDWRYVEPDRWWVEYFPAHIFSFAESACVFHDLVPAAVLCKQYFDDTVNPEYERWKGARQ